MKMYLKAYEKREKEREDKLNLCLRLRNQPWRGTKKVKTKWDVNTATSPVVKTVIPPTHYLCSPGTGVAFSNVCITAAKTQRLCCDKMQCFVIGDKPVKYPKPFYLKIFSRFGFSQRKL